MVLDLFQENESGVVVEAVAWGAEMLVERQSRWLVHIVAVCVEPQVGRRLGFAYILVPWAFQAISEI